jgi:hypothetical protein
MHNFADMKKIGIIIIGLFLVFLCGFAAEKRALIVAISDYPPHSGWREINADNDVERLMYTLTRQGFLEENIIILRNSEATKQGIVAGFRLLQSQVKQGDFVFVHFSAHGQQMENLDGTEPDGLDEAIVPYDAQFRFIAGVYEGENHLRDKKINELLMPIRRTLGESGKLIVSIDACHAESMTRGDDDDVVVRGTPTIFASPEFLRNFRRCRVAEVSQLPLIQERGLAPITELAASQAHEENLEHQSGDRNYGSLTYALTTVWDRHNAFSFGVWLEEIREIMRNSRTAQWQTPVFRTTLEEYADKFN